MNKRAARWYRGKPAAIQNFINDERRRHADEMMHGQEADEVEYWMYRKDMARGGPHSPGVVEAVRKSAKAHREGGLSPMARPLQKANEQGSPQLEGEGVQFGTPEQRQASRQRTHDLLGSKFDEMQKKKATDEGEKSS